MVKVQICGSGDIPLDQVVDPTTTQRFVRKPSIQPCFLSAMSSEDATLVIEIDGQKVAQHPLRAGITPIPLNMLVPPPQRSGIFALMPMARLASQNARQAPSEPTEFVAIVHDGGPEGTVLGTYNFKLMSEGQFDAAYSRYSNEQAPQSEPTVFTTDASSVANARNCWNCHQPLTADCCAGCGCCQQHDDEEPQS